MNDPDFEPATIDVDMLRACKEFARNYWAMFQAIRDARPDGVSDEMTKDVTTSFMIGWQQGKIRAPPKQQLHIKVGTGRDIIRKKHEKKMLPTDIWREEMELVRKYDTFENIPDEKLDILAAKLKAMQG